MAKQRAIGMEGDTGSMVADPQTGEIALHGQQEVAIREEPKLPSAREAEMEKDAGRGISHKAEDSIVPMVYILQKGSPQVEKRGPDYIEGAEPGDIWLKNNAKPIIKGEDGIIVQPCWFTKNIVEWIPRDDGGGFVGLHMDNPDDAEEYEDPKTGVKRWRRPDGKKGWHELVDTRYHYVLIAGAPYVIPFSSTGHTVSKNWTALISTFKLRNGIDSQPAWNRKYLMRTRLATKNEFSWFMFKIDDIGYEVSDQEYYAGRRFCDEAEAGTKTMENPDGRMTEVNPEDRPRVAEDRGDIPF